MTKAEFEAELDDIIENLAPEQFLKEDVLVGLGVLFDHLDSLEDED